ncbi:MAG: abortive infection system antitoxin AbiGi family protein [Bryobacteraceae bacterium]
MLIQRYVLSDLTHFVGRRLRSQAERYKLLKRILKDGLLKASPKAKGAGPLVRVLRKDPDLRLSSNRACGLPAVCFCDIPLCDLPLHMAKYRDFGLAFSKDLLTDFGALPIVYVAERGRPASLPFEGYARGRVASQTVCFDEFWKVFNRVDAALSQLKTQKGAEPLAKDLRRMITFLEFHLVSNLKFFDHRLADTDPRNYYMEREWRVCQNIPFTLDDVVRVIMPERFGGRFRRDFPTFTGEVVFADWEH